MTEKQRRVREISRREAEMYRVEAIQAEMASAIRLLGGDGSAKDQNRKAATATGLSITTVERLRWKKIKRPFTDISDAVREAVKRHNEGSLKRAAHEVFIAQQQAAVLRARLEELDPAFAGSYPGLDRRTNADVGG
ncbi:hypothetical protein C7I85_12100 [Mesorhizobium soli]|uniref:Uncharacterized protein n=1 Tax=Pseudaminobacter soli (ex Li et al. 2025) TaxID=1295366 RepID=A0A2P7SE81_9HYPH|nr:hypothetical protein C7I85_12100 [Mesorhizobium soli]